MHVYPASAEEKLGFLPLRRKLEGYLLSELGAERLREAKPSRSLPWVEGELRRADELRQAFVFDDPVPFDHVLDVRPVLRRLAPHDAFVQPDDLLAVRLVVATVRRLRGYVLRRQDDYPALAEAARAFVPLKDVEDRINEVVEGTPEEGGAKVRDQASPKLQSLRQQIVSKERQVREALYSALKDAQQQGYATEEQPTIRAGRMVIPVRAEAKRKVEGFVQDVSQTGQTVFIEPTACLHLNNELRELQAEERHEVERILRSVAGMLRGQLPELRQNMQQLADWDLLQAKAKLARDLDAVPPQLSDDGVVDVVEGRHPGLQLHFRRLAEEEGGEARQVVPLDLALGESFRTLVITGPNAGGKTVAMKTVGLFALMLSYGLPLPADEKTRFSLFGRLIVDIGDEQSIEEDLSTFSSHVTNLRHMLEEADDRTLVLIDEAGTGTDPAEGGALAQAVLERLTQRGARTICTTHHGALKAYAHDADRVENGSMAFDTETLQPSYRFRAGIPGSSYAMEIAGRIGLPQRVMDRSRELMGQQQAALEDLVTEFETRTDKLQRELDAAEIARDEAQKAQNRYEHRVAALERDRERMRTDALEEAQRIVQEASARVERTIREIKEAQAEREATKAARAKLEEYKGEVGEQRERAEEGEHPTPSPSPKKQKQQQQAPRNGQTKAPSGPIAEGDQVRLDGGATVAEVLELDGNEAVVAAGQMRMRVKTKRLEKVGGPRKQEVTVRGGYNQSSASLPAVRAQQRIDVRGQRAREAVETVIGFLDDAVAANLDHTEILHGKGTGALRAAIHEYLAGRSDVTSFEEARPQEGGSGVTLVTLA